MPNPLDIERASVIVISTAHLSPQTISDIEAASGQISEGPSIALREEGFLMNSHHGDARALDRDVNNGVYKSLLERYPDMTLVRALARGAKAEWVSFDRDGEIYDDYLPVYEDDGSVTPPKAEGWAEALSEVGTAYWGNDAIIPSVETLRVIEAGQTPGLDLRESLDL